MMKATRVSLSVFALGMTICSLVHWAKAQEKNSDEHKMMSGDSMKISPEEMKMSGEHMDKMKMMASEHPQEMAADMARMMVMDKMAMHMAMDPSFMHMLDQSMNDPKMKMAHDDAKKMAEDPAQMAKMKQQIMDDPKAMQMVMHMAGTMAMMHGGMMDHGMMKEDKMKDAPAEKK